MSKVVTVQASTLTERKTVQVLSTLTIKDILDEAEITVREGTTLSVNGLAVNETKLHDKLQSFAVDLDEIVFLTAVVNSKNA